MKFSLYSKSIYNFNSHKKSKEQLSRAKLGTRSTNRSTPKSQSDSCLKTHFKMFPQHKKRHNISLFNFFLNKFPTKTKEVKTDANDQQKQGQIFVEGIFINKEKKGIVPRLSTQKLVVLPKKSHSQIDRFLQSIQNVEEQEQNNQKKSANILGEVPNRNIKFDRKKYMYHRYKKTTTSHENSNKLAGTLENSHSQRFDTLGSDNSHRVNSPGKQFQTVNNKCDIKLEDALQLQNSKNSPQKSNLYGIVTIRHNSFIQKKRKLAIQPMPRKVSYALIDRKSQSKTTRQEQATQIKQLSQYQKSGTKISPQAIHHKQPKRIIQKHPQVLKLSQ